MWNKGIRDIYENFDRVPKDAKIAIWGISQRSNEVFCETLNRRIKVSYFIDHNGGFLRGAVRNQIFDKPVLTKEELLEEAYRKEKIFILAEKSKACDKDISWLEENYKGAYYACRVSDIDPSIRNSDKIYIYGAGSSGKRTYRILREQGLTSIDFVDSDRNKWDKKIQENGIDARIYAPDALKEDSVVVISTGFYHEIKEDLLRRGVQCQNIFVDIRNSAEYSECPIRYKGRVRLWFEYTKFHTVKSMGWFGASVVLMTDFRDKKVVLYGVNELTPQFVSLFQLLGIKVFCCADSVDKNSVDEFRAGVEYRDINELIRDRTSDMITYVIKVEETEKGLRDADYTVLEKLGLCFAKEIRLFDLGRSHAIRDSSIESGFGIKRDKLLDYTYVYKRTSLQYPGYVVLGDVTTAKKRIMILGNSTSDVGRCEYFTKTWPEFLLEEIKDTVIFCGAISAYTSKQELLKLLRDGKQLCLDLVISYGGVCDQVANHTEGYPYAGMKLQGNLLEKEAWGIKTNTSMAEEWVESERMMKQIANSYGAEFVGIFQPLIMNKDRDSMTFEERVICEWHSELANISLEEYKVYQEEVKAQISSLSYVHDMTRLFQGESSFVFKDYVHLTEEGNRMLAEAIYKIIRKYY